MPSATRYNKVLATSPTKVATVIDTTCRAFGLFKTDDGELHGFTASKSTGSGYHSYSFYTSDNLSKSDIHDMLKEFGF